MPSGGASSPMSAAWHQCNSVCIVVMCVLGAVALMWLQVTMSSPAHVLDSPHRGAAGRPLVQTARHLPAPHAGLRVRYHSHYSKAFLDGLNISGPGQMGRVAHLHSVLMGVSDPTCDDGRTDLSIDWQEGGLPYFCPDEQRLYSGPTAPLIDCQRHLPDDIPLRHVCMNETLKYDDGVPTYGHHRPLWPVYGTYRYLPPQRWLHSVEHGAAVLLHHPCADPRRVQILRDLVRRCIYKHVVTPSRRVSRRRPLVLVAHGCQFQMSRINTELVVAFIRAHALHGKEGHLAKQGQFRDQLIEVSAPPEGSDVNDTKLCPFYPNPTASDALFHQDHAGSV